MHEGTEQEGKPGSSHSHAFDKAIDVELSGKEPPSDRDKPFVEPEPRQVTFQVVLKWNPNPGWEVDKYIAKVGGS